MRYPATVNCVAEYLVPKPVDANGIHHGNGPSPALASGFPTINDAKRMTLQDTIRMTFIPHVSHSFVRLQIHRSDLLGTAYDLPDRL